MATQFTTADAAAHVAQFNAAQPTASVAQVLSLDEQIDQIRSAAQIAKDAGNRAELARLRSAWEALKQEMDAAEAEAAPEAAPLPFEPRRTRVAISLDALAAAIDHARAIRPSKRLESAYEWLLPLASVAFDMDGKLVVDSATWSHSWYRTDGYMCDCPARKPCWHQAAWDLVQDVLRRQRHIGSAIIAL